MLEVVEGKNSFGYIYEKIKRVLSIDSRDFYDKGFQFQHNNVYYRYTTTIENSEARQPVPANTVRGTTLHNFGKMWRDNDGKIRLTVLSQYDFRI